MKQVKLKVGCHGITREGEVVGPFRAGTNDRYPFVDDEGNEYQKNGHLVSGAWTLVYDIIRVIPKSYTLWTGGKCPVDGNPAVKVIFRTGDKMERNASYFAWDYTDTFIKHEHQIVAYKIEKAKPKSQITSAITTMLLSKYPTVSREYITGAMEMLLANLDKQSL